MKVIKYVGTNEFWYNSTVWATWNNWNQTYSSKLNIQKTKQIWKIVIF